MSHVEGARREFVKAAMDAPFLTREEEHGLAVRWKEEGSERAMHRLAGAHMRLVIAIAARFRHYGLSMADLIQEGHVGLLEAAARFDPYREVRFSTYATWWIRASIQDYILRNWSIVRGGTSSAQKALFFNLRRLRARITQAVAAGRGRAGEGGGEGRDVFAEIALAIGVSEGDVRLMDARLSGPDTSLNAPLSETDGGTSQRQDFLVDAGPLQDESVGNSIDTERRARWLRDALGVLNEREARIVRDRRLSDEGETLEALGARLGISKERVRQIETRALEKLRGVLVARHGDARAAMVGAA